MPGTRWSGPIGRRVESNWVRSDPGAKTITRARLYLAGQPRKNLNQDVQCRLWNTAGGGGGEMLDVSRH